MSFYFPSQTRVIIDIVLYKRVVFVRFIYIKENNNSIGDAMYREKNPVKSVHQDTDMQ